jgi:hypothetical protein
MSSWMEEFLQPLLDHRDRGHALRFQPKNGSAKVYCFQCKSVVMDGGRNLVHEVYEAALQWPRENLSIDARGFPGSEKVSA